MLQHDRISDFGAARRRGFDRWSDYLKRWCFRALLVAAEAGAYKGKKVGIGEDDE